MKGAELFLSSISTLVYWFELGRSHQCSDYLGTKSSLSKTLGRSFVFGAGSYAIVLPGRM